MPLVFIVAEFIIHLAEKNNTFDKFKKVLLENGAEFSVSIISSFAYVRYVQMF